MIISDIKLSDTFDFLSKHDNSYLIDTRSKEEWLSTGIPDLSSINKEATLVEWSQIIDQHFFDYYENLLLGSEKKTMICTNPDLIVDRGNEQEYCAGTIAKIFEKIGGKVIYFGKPYKEIYDLLISKTEKVLIIGDNLRTDIKGANYLKKDSLFILNGVHKNEIKKFRNLETFFEKYNIKPNFIQNDLNW